MNLAIEMEVVARMYASNRIGLTLIGRNLLLAIAIATATVSCLGQRSQIQTYDFLTQTGWLHGPCLAIKNTSIAPGTKLVVITMGNTQSILEGTVTGKAESASDCLALLADRRKVNERGSRSFYKVEIEKPLQSNFIGIGFINAPSTVSLSGNVARVDLDGDGRPEIMGSCQTTEGINFFVSSAGSGKGKQLWSDYYYLGYESTPNCPEQ